MEISREVIAGDVPGVAYTLTVLRFRGRGRGPSAYLQAALHGCEQPGVLVLDFLAARLRQAEAAGTLLGEVTLVPFANPIALGQELFGRLQGRFDQGSRTNFNRAFPASDAEPADATGRLKRRLLDLAAPAELVLDLHCDDESVPYLYVHHAFWPEAGDLAAALGDVPVVLWEGDGGGAFEEAAASPMLAAPAGRLVTTVELRGQADVALPLAEADAAGLERFLAGRGVLAGVGRPAYAGLAAPIENIEVVRAPVGGTVVFLVAPGQRVLAGQPLVRLLARPGEADGATDVLAPQAGLVLTRCQRRFVGAGQDLVKLVAARPSAAARPGPLEP